MKALPAVLLVILFVGLSASAEASRTMGEYPFCDTEEAYEEALRAIIKNDVKWFKSLPCAITRPGMKIERLEGWFGRCKARLWAMGTSSIVWTPCKNIGQ